MKKFYLGSELLNAVEHLRHVATFVKVNRLKRSGLGHSVGFTELQEVCDILHLKIKNVFVTYDVIVVVKSSVPASSVIFPGYISTCLKGAFIVFAFQGRRLRPDKPAVASITRLASLNAN